MDRAFSVPELKVLIDAVHAASFITEKKTAVLWPFAPPVPPWSTVASD